MKIYRVESEYPCPYCGEKMTDYVLTEVQSNLFGVKAEVHYLANAICPACNSYQGPWTFGKFGKRRRVGIPDPEPKINPSDRIFLN